MLSTRCGALWYTPRMPDGNLSEIVRRVWGYDALRPFQSSAMECILAGRDSLVVLPTGGGKSLCSQAPALARDGMAVVVSPLLSLMKDQVEPSDGGGGRGVHQQQPDRAGAPQSTSHQAGDMKLLYVAPRACGEAGFHCVPQSRRSFIAVDGRTASTSGATITGVPGAGEPRGFPRWPLPTPPPRRHTCARTSAPRSSCAIGDYGGLGRPPEPGLRRERRTNELKQVMEVVERAGAIGHYSSRAEGGGAGGVTDRGHKPCPTTPG